MPQFEVFRKRMAPLVKTPYVTIQKRGVLSINAAAYTALGQPEAVELLYDPDEKIVGLRRTERDSEHAYPVRTTASQSESTFMVSATAFTKYYGIDTTTSVRRPARMDSEVLCVDLKDPGTAIVGNRVRVEMPEPHLSDLSKGPHRTRDGRYVESFELEGGEEPVSVFDQPI